MVIKSAGEGYLERVEIVRDMLGTYAANSPYKEISVAMKFFDPRSEITHDDLLLMEELLGIKLTCVSFAPQQRCGAYKFRTCSMQ